MTFEAAPRYVFVCILIHVHVLVSCFYDANVEILLMCYHHEFMNHRKEMVHFVLEHLVTDPSLSPSKNYVKVMKLSVSSS